jgi:hypothetical protein
MRNATRELRIIKTLAKFSFEIQSDALLLEQIYQVVVYAYGLNPFLLCHQRTMTNANSSNFSRLWCPPCLADFRQRKLTRCEVWVFFCPTRIKCIQIFFMPCVSIVDWLKEMIFASSGFLVQWWRVAPTPRLQNDLQLRTQGTGSSLGTRFLCVRLSFLGFKHAH